MRDAAAVLRFPTLVLLALLAAGCAHWRDHDEDDGDRRAMHDELVRMRDRVEESAHRTEELQQHLQRFMERTERAEGGMKELSAGFRHAMERVERLEQFVKKGDWEGSNYRITRPAPDMQHVEEMAKKAEGMRREAEELRAHNRELKAALERTRHELEKMEQELKELRERR